MDYQAEAFAQMQKVIDYVAQRVEPDRAARMQWSLDQRDPMMMQLITALQQKLEGGWVPKQGYLTRVPSAPPPPPSMTLSLAEMAALLREAWAMYQAHKGRR